MGDRKVCLCARIISEDSELFLCADPFNSPGVKFLPPGTPPPPLLFCPLSLPRYSRVMRAFPPMNFLFDPLLGLRIFYLHMRATPLSPNRFFLLTFANRNPPLVFSYLCFSRRMAG